MAFHQARGCSLACRAYMPFGGPHRSRLVDGCRAHNCKRCWNIPQASLPRVSGAVRQAGPRNILSSRGKPAPMQAGACANLFAFCITPGSYTRAASMLFNNVMWQIMPVEMSLSKDCWCKCMPATEIPRQTMISALSLSREQRGSVHCMRSAPSALNASEAIHGRFCQIVPNQKLLNVAP